MTDGARRALLVLTGVLSFLFYVAIAVVLANVATVVLADPPAPGVLVAAVVASGLAFGYLSYRAGPTRILGALDARPVPRATAPRLHERLEAIADRMDVRAPSVYVAALDAPNALAVGARGGGVVVLDHRLPRILRPEELDAILAHELAHLEGYDGLVQTLAASVLQTVAGIAFLAILPVGFLFAGLSRTATYLAGQQPEPFRVHLQRTHYRVGQLVVLALLAFTLALRAHSRRRELAADDRAVDVTGDPLALARGLRRIQRASDPYRGLWSSLFVHGEEDALTELLATHPSMDDRIERLRAMADDRQRITVDVE
ncbi:M48 family metalloprotease [Halorubellus sp. JP-L1]|uniref:M48 family metallopeptidase n=1 Tax=Halorubellus sp. JP-L1 TaxID=2715753 RepID=UPI00140DFEEE|nr:M48 family metalloprotease [Halorubellus sp. JP-L1]NHN41477.1 M48 family metalloprotease [Halorubellus sp. JP-L1]